jgi:hypothetical protein
LAIAEDGGELLVMSAIAAYAYQLGAEGLDARLHLPRLLGFGPALHTYAARYGAPAA